MLLAAEAGGLDNFDLDHMLRSKVMTKGLLVGLNERFDNVVPATKVQGMKKEDIVKAFEQAQTGMMANLHEQICDIIQTAGRLRHASDRSTPAVAPPSNMMLVLTGLDHATSRAFCPTQYMNSCRWRPRVHAGRGDGYGPG